MPTRESLKRRALAFKNRLWFNGDWLFVFDNLPTEQLALAIPVGNQVAAKAEAEVDVNNTEPEQQEVDFCNVAAIRRALFSNDIELLKLIYERAKKHESTFSDTASRVYDKAK